MVANVVSGVAVDAAPEGLIWARFRVLSVYLTPGGWVNLNRSAFLRSGY
jgi:hypothetical protein